MDVPAEWDTVLDLERTLKAAQRGSRLVQQILAFSRPTQEGFMPTDVAEVAREALGIFSATLPRNITVVERLGNQPAVAYADPTQLHQIIMNLCANAFQSMRDTGGHMDVELTEEDLDEAPGRTDLPGERPLPAPGRVRQRAGHLPGDHGPASSTPFSPPSPRARARALGLAVVHGIVRAHKGGLKVTSQSWVRTSFEIFLPHYASHVGVPGRPGLEVPDAPGTRARALHRGRPGPAQGHSPGAGPSWATGSRPSAAGPKPWTT